MHVLIPAGGRGVRLRPLTNECPKPLLPLGDRPILSHIVQGLPDGWPVTLLVTPELAPDFLRWKAEQPTVREITVWVEPQRSGPAGPVVALGECVEQCGIQDDLVIMMGDSLLPFTLRDFLGRGTEQARLAAYRLPDPRDATRFGVVEWNQEGRLLAFEEKPQRPRSPWIFTGCLYLPERMRKALPSLAAQGMPQMGHLVAAYLAQGEEIGVFPVTEPWHDIGTFRSYVDAHAQFVRSAAVNALREAGNRLEGVVYVHPTARVQASLLKDCVIGAGADVRDADLSECIVQSGATVSGRVMRGTLVSSRAELALSV